MPVTREPRFITRRPRSAPRRLCPAPFGLLPEHMDFDDHRAVGAARLPFLIRRSTPTFSNTQKYEEITLNVPVDAPIFKRP